MKKLLLTLFLSVPCMAGTATFNFASGGSVTISSPLASGGGGGCGSQGGTISKINSAHGTKGPPSPLSVTVPSTSAGNLMIVATVVGGGVAGSVTGVTDNASGGSNTYQAAPGTYITGTHGAIQSSEIWYSENIKAGATSVTITWTPSGSTDMETFIREYTGVCTSGVLATGSGAHVDGSGTIVGPTLTPGMSGELLYAMGESDYIYSFTGVNSPWTFIENYAPSDDLGDASYINATSGVGTNATFTTSPGTVTGFTSVGARFLPK